MGRIGCNIGEPDNWFGDEPRDYSNRAPDHPVGPEALQAFARGIKDGERGVEPYTITISSEVNDAICAAMGVESFTLEQLIAWAAKEYDHVE